MDATTRRSALIFAGGLLVWLACAAIPWLAPRPLGHDEAQYALAARDLLAGEPQRWFYLSAGMSAVATLGVVAGDTEVTLRLPALVLGVGFVLAAAWLAWRVYGPAVAAWVVAVIAGTRAFSRRGADLLSDLPAAGLLLAGTAVIAVEVTREGGPRWRAVLAAPLLAAALYLRYASCVPIALLGVAALVAGARQIARRPLPIVATAALFLALLVPHALAALRETGSVTGILLASSGVPGRAYFAEGLVTYVTSDPFRYYGLLAPPLLLAGLAAGAVALVRGGDARARRTALLGAVGAGHVVALGIISHAQVRYIFFGVALLVIAGVAAVHGAIAARPPRARAVLGGAAALAVVAAWGLGLGTAIRGARAGGATPATLAAAAAIRADAAGARCHVVGDAYTQLEWYSGCRSEQWPWGAIERGEPVYVVRAAGQPLGEVRGRPRALLERPDVTVTRFAR